MIRKPFVHCALVVIAVALAYANSLKNDFAAMDDALVIVDNNFIKSVRNLPRLFNRSYLTRPADVKHLGLRDIGAGEATYRPVVTISYFLDYALWKLNPFGYHLHNLVLHAGNALLVYWLALLLGSPAGCALAAALFFGLHPVNGEAVNVPSFREDLQCCLFFFLSLIFFIKTHRMSAGDHRRWLYTASLVSFLFALLAKEMAVSLPLILFAYVCYFAPNGPSPIQSPRRMSHFIPYGGILLFYAWMRFSAMAPDAACSPPHIGNAYITVISMLKVVAHYLRWFILPSDTHFILPGDETFIARSFFAPNVIASLGSIILWITAIVITFRRRRVASFGLLWIAVTLLPVLNIMPLFDFAAGRYLYLPAAGFCLSLAALLWQPPGMRFFSFTPESWKLIRRDAVIILCIFYGLFTAARNLSWRNFVVFWENLAEQYPRNVTVHVKLGDSYRAKNRLDQAAREYRLALEINPSSAGAHGGLGVCYQNKRIWSKAEEEFKTALSLDADSPFTANSLGCVYMMTARYAEAVTLFQRAIALEPGCPLWYKNLGNAYLALGQWERAERAWRIAHRLDPNDPELARNLQLLLKNRG